MSAAEYATEEPHVVLIGGRLYGSGDTRQQAITDFRAQIAGGTPAMRASMAARATIVNQHPSGTLSKLQLTH